MNDKSLRHNYYLNEQHEFRSEREGRGRLPKLAPIDWAGRGAKLSAGLSAVRERVKNTPDPVQRLFFEVEAFPSLRKETSAVGREPVFEQAVDISGNESVFLSRLGLEVMSSTPHSAVVHASPGVFERLETTSSRLPAAGRREQARWAAVKGFSATEWTHRVDPAWLKELVSKEAVETIVALHPVLSRAEVDLVFRFIVGHVKVSTARLQVGRDFGGRSWIKTDIPPSKIRSLAEMLGSVQSLFAPIVGTIDVPKRGGKRPVRRTTASPSKENSASVVSQLPSVAVFDTGIPENHSLLSGLVRGRYTHSEAQFVPAASHGSEVASRVVFGDLDIQTGVPVPSPTPGARIVDVRVCEDSRHPYLQGLPEAMADIATQYPDVRVYNVSLGLPVAFALESEKRRQEILNIVQDIDNVASAYDVVVVVAAGNAVAGIAPSVAYPDHHQDPDWGLGGLALGFNSVCVGGAVGRFSTDGLGAIPGAPSPFTKTGPGLAGSFPPDMSAEAGDVGANYQFSPGMGVSVCTASGFWEDSIGTSLSTPIVSREFARAFATLAPYCDRGSRPSAALAKAALAATCTRPEFPAPVEKLAMLTLGYGKPEAHRIAVPGRECVRFFWQGEVSASNETVRIQVVIPSSWVAGGAKPVARCFWSWVTPVNGAVPAVFGCRAVTFRLRPGPDAKALRGSRSRNRNRGYPLQFREYDLSKADTPPSDGVWEVELMYEERAEPPPGVVVDDGVSAAFVLELVSDGSDGVALRSAVASQPLAAGMLTLSGRAAVQPPIRLRPLV